MGGGQVGSFAVFGVGCCAVLLLCIGLAVLFDGSPRFLRDVAACFRWLTLISFAFGTLSSPTCAREFGVAEASSAYRM